MRLGAFEIQRSELSWVTHQLGDSTGGHAPADRWQVCYIGSVVATAATRAAAKTRMHELEDANPHMRGRLTIRDSRRQQ